MTNSANQRKKTNTLPKIENRKMNAKTVNLQV